MCVLHIDEVESAKKTNLELVEFPMDIPHYLPA